MGLSISRELAKLMGGSIEYSPRDDGDTGSVFTFSLPLEIPSKELMSSPIHMKMFSPKGKRKYVFSFLSMDFHLFSFQT